MLFLWWGMDQSRTNGHRGSGTGATRRCVAQVGHGKGRTMTQTVDFTGSVSHGTMRPADLIPSFFDVLTEYHPEKASEIVRAEGLLPICAPSHIDWEQWVEAHPESAGYLLEELFDALGEMAPKWFYFGAHAGDGSDYGFWRTEE